MPCRMSAWLPHITRIVVLKDNPHSYFLLQWTIRHIAHGPVSRLYVARACVCVLQVPYDPDLPFLFFGEEMGMLARMWTRGWDVVAPTQV